MRKLLQGLWPYLLGVLLASLVVWIKSGPTVIPQAVVEVSNVPEVEEMVAEPQVVQEEELRRLFNEALHEEAVKLQPPVPETTQAPAQSAKGPKAAPVCRQRWTKYLGQNKLPLPPKFDEACKRYNRLHDKNLREQDLQDSLEINLYSAKNTIRYLVWCPVGEDVGGQLGSLLSAYLLALLTDRVLLVDEPRMGDVLCEPFTRSSWILPAGLGNLLRVKALSMDEAVATRAPVRIAQLRLQAPNPNLADDKHKLSCHGSVKGALNHIQWLLVEAGWPWAELLLNNPTHAVRLAELFEGQPVYQLLLRFLIHPSNAQWEKATAMYHTFYSDETDKPHRLAIFATPQETAKPAMIRSCVEMALKEIFQDPLARATLHYHPSLTGRDPEPEWRQVWPNFDRFIISGSSLLYVPGTHLPLWKQLIIDLWMAFWANQVMLTVPIEEHGAMSNYAGFMARQMREGPVIQAYPQNEECTLAVFDQWTLLDIPTLCEAHRRA